MRRGKKGRKREERERKKNMKNGGGSDGGGKERMIWKEMRKGECRGEMGMEGEKQ